MANNPDVIFADEPTTALDVTVQAQVLEALEAARAETGAALVLITHDLGVIAGHADRVCVMYAGKLVETGTVEDVFYTPRMPYTLGLLSSLPRVDEGGRQRLTPIVGSPPSLLNLPPGCPFTPRVCPRCFGVGGWPIRDGRWCRRSCDARTSVTAGTIFDRTRTPLTVWFHACWVFATQKDGISSQSLQRALEIGSYPTAWALLRDRSNAHYSELTIMPTCGAPALVGTGAPVVSSA